MKFSLKSFLAVFIGLLTFTAPNAFAQQWQSNGSDIYYNNGNVGIGTTSPAEKLEVLGRGYFESGIDIRYTQYLLARNNDNNWVEKAILKTGWENGAGDYLDFFVAGGYGGTGVFNPSTKMRITYSGNVGIGTKTPSAKLHIDGGIKIGNADPFDPDPNFYENENFIAFRHAGYSEDFIGYKRNTFYFKDSSGGGDIDDPNVVIGGKLGLGTDNLSHKLEVNGIIRSKEVKVEASSWPDHVFSDKYQLLDLASLEDFVTSNNHLPGVPTKKEIGEEGQNLGAVQAKLLQKIEELTLYLIKLKKAHSKRVHVLTKKNKKLESLINHLEKRVNDLESTN